jgi:hypothetical protein
MDKITASFQHAYILLRKHWQIIAIALLISIRPVVNLFIKLPSLVTFIISFIELGWLGTRFEFVKIAYEKNKIPWNQFWNYIFKYIKKLFPIAVLLLFVFMILFFVAIFYYGKWYLGSGFLSNQDTGIRKQQVFDVFTSLQNPLTLQRFMAQFGILLVLIQYLFNVLFFIGTITLTILVVDGYGVIKSFLKSFGFIKNHFLFFCVIIIINIVLATIIGRISILFGTGWTKSLQTNVLLAYGINLPIQIIHILIDSATIIYYIESKRGWKKS